MYKIINGDSAEQLKDYDDNYFDSVVCDPPYGIEFLAKEWDKNTGAIEVWQECYRVLKPGGHLLAFSAARTYHKLATNIESVGFEIRDQIMWMYASGFPKAQDVGRHIQKQLGVKETKPGQKGGAYAANQQPGGAISIMNDDNITKWDEIIPTADLAKQWEGWKPALKPAHEPIVMARKPMIGSTAKNVLEYRTGALNIDGSRIPFEDEDDAEYMKLEYENQMIRNNGQAGNGPALLDRRKERNGIGKKKKSDKEKYLADWRPAAMDKKYDENEQFSQYGKLDGTIPRSNRKKKSDKEMVIKDRQNHEKRHTDYKSWGFAYHNDAEPQKPKKKSDKEKMIANKAAKGHSNTFHNADAETYHSTDKKDNTNPDYFIPNDAGRYPSNVIGEIEGYQKYFFCPKVSRRERQIGMGVIEGFNRDQSPMESTGTQVLHKRDIQKFPGNNHPTVKPVDLMSYLVKLVTPPGGIVLDPFCGSGSTGMACVQHEFNFVGIDLDERYCKISIKRIDAWKKEKVTTFNQLFKETT